MPFGSIELNDGNKIPAIAYGTGSKWKGKSIVEYVTMAIESGFNHIDTAQFYQTEGDVGIAIRESALARTDFYITTKFSGGAVQESFQTSLEKLGLKYVDLYLIHSPSFLGSDYSATWKTFESIKKSGQAKSVGVSNFRLEDFDKLMAHANIIPAVNQIKLHPYNYIEMKPILDYCEKHSIVVEAYSSLAPITQYPGGPVDVPLADAAAKRGATPTQIIFLWAIRKGVVIVTTSSNKSRMEQYLAVGELRPLTDEEVLAIDEAGAKGPPLLTWKMTSVMVRQHQKRLFVCLAALLVLLFHICMRAYLASEMVSW